MNKLFTILSIPVLSYQIDPNESSSRQSAEFLSDSENNVNS
jgi:uncharacterized membrane protein